MDARFLRYVSAINTQIVGFNQHLVSAYQIPSLDPAKMNEEKSGIKIPHGDWTSWQFPNGWRHGVYFIFGWKKSNPSENGLYVGKASFGSCIGKRLDHWLRPCKDSEQFEMNGKRGEKYVLDYISTLDLDRLNIGFMASALEEYLITQLSDELNLLNETGN